MRKIIILALVATFTLPLTISRREKKTPGEKIEDGIEEVGEGIKDGAKDVEGEIKNVGDDE